MTPVAEMLAQLRGALESDPLLVIAFVASAIAYASTPLAFLILGRMNYLQSRRGRTFQPPSLVSVVVGMILVMGIPAIFCALVLKSRTYDRNRYEFDPNQNWSVLEQGRGYRDLKEADEALRQERQRLDSERRALANSLKDFDKAIIDAVNEMGGASPKLVATIKKSTVDLGAAHKWAQVDAPQQLADLTATSVDLLVARNAAYLPVDASPTAAVTPVNGLPRATVDAELAKVPAPQRRLAALLPFTDLPAGWTVGKMGDVHLETFNAENLYEKIDGRAESFLLFNVQGMAYTFYHPTGDESNEVQVYLFEMGDSLKALGKFGSEKPEEEATSLPIGKEGYSSAGSMFMYLGKYYAQIVATKDDPRFNEFALTLARRIEAGIDPALAASRSPAATPGTGAAPSPATAPQVGPDELFRLLPTAPKRGEPKYSAADVFGYAFLADVFLADYSEGDSTWQGFLHTSGDAEEARALFAKYEKAARENGAEIKKIEASEADLMMEVSNFGLIDVVFAKGNAFGGANGAPNLPQAEAFARAFAKSLPARSPYIATEPTSPAPENPEKSESDP